MSRKIRKVRRAKFKSITTAANADQLYQILRYALGTTLGRYSVIVDEKIKYYPEEIAYFNAIIPNNHYKETATYSISLDLTIIYSTKDKDKHLNKNSKILQKTVRNFAKTYKKSYRLKKDIDYIINRSDDSVNVYIPKENK